MQTPRTLFRLHKSFSCCRRIAANQDNHPIFTVALAHRLSLQRCRSTSTDVVPPPSANIAVKSYSPKIEKLVNDIGQLTLLEVSDLNELLKRTLNIQDAPIMSMGAMQAVGQKAPEEEEVAPKREKMSFTVKLTKFDAGKKVQLIKEIKNLVEGLNLVQAKKFVEAVPQVVKADVTKEEAEKLKEALAAVGAEVEIE
ncbi:unnamed protein product [Lymnaea stagnalis]|uniref:Large ribosomal subunit protein bL12m n=1 Tax=Lymnaea stagnalis TaxID=6523 RepID=A0AAV2IAC4_LYMST